MARTEDLHAPDLYLPLMAFVTYILLGGLCQGLGLGGGSSVFTPDSLIQSIWRSLAVLCIESAIAKFALSQVSYSMPFLDAFSYCGYKYIGLCLTIVAKLLGKFASILCGLYTSLAFAYVLLKTLSSLLPQSAGLGAGAGTDFRVQVICGVALMELLIALFQNSL